MKLKIIAILTTLLTIFIIIFVLVFSTKIRINSPCKLFVTNTDTVLVIEDKNVYNDIKSYKYFDLIDQTTNESSRFYIKKNYTQTIENLIFLQNNKDSLYKPGWYEVLVFIKTESFAEHYLGF